MKTTNHSDGPILRALILPVLAVLAAGLLATPVLAQFLPEPIILFDTELLELNLTGLPVPMPLASDPGNLLGDSIDGYGFVDSQVEVKLSSQRPASPGPPSLGQACAAPGTVPGAGLCAIGGSPTPLTPQDIADLDGQNFVVDSFFDVFFDIEVTDVDLRPGRDYAGQPDGATIVLPDVGPASMSTHYLQVFDADAPSFGLIPPPEVSPYIGHFTIEIPLGGDLNGNGIPDKMKFTLATHTVNDVGRSFIILPDGTVIDEFDSAADLTGAVVDVTSDPPFFIPLTGPTTASSKLLNPIVPEPTSAILCLVGLGLGIPMARSRRRQL